MECEVLELMAEGHSNIALAQHLSITERAIVPGPSGTKRLEKA
jgi:DNA-binding CsgD family transcriptional regulator